MTPETKERIPGVSWKRYKQDVRDAWDNLLISLRPPALRAGTTASTGVSPRHQAALILIAGYALGWGLAAVALTVFRDTPAFFVLTSIPAALPIAAAIALHIARQRRRQAAQA